MPTELTFQPGTQVIAVTYVSELSGATPYTVDELRADGWFTLRNSVGNREEGWFNPAWFQVYSLPRTGKIKSDGSSTEYFDIPDGVKDLLDLIEYKRMSFGIGNIFKACYRLGEKEGIDVEYDLRKIIFFAQRALDRRIKGVPDV